MTLIPGVQYVKNGDFTLAYQVTGTGTKDLIYLPPETPNVVGNWFVPEHARFMDRLTSFTRLVITDRRGMGCSDRLPPGQAPTLEEMVDDLLVLMEAAYASPGTVFAGGETGFIALLAAATHPDRFDGLILWGASASWRRSEDLPWEDTDDTIEATLGTIRRVTNLRSWAERFTRDSLPSWAGEPEKVATIEALSALAGSAEAWYQDQLMFHGVDLRDLLPSVRVPALIMGRAGTRRMYAIESSRFLAERLPDARLVEFDGADALPWVGDAGAVLDSIEEFMTGARRTPDASRALSTVLFSDIVDSTALSANFGDERWRRLRETHDRSVRELLVKFHGREIKTLGDGFLATFDGPARGVRCGVAILESVKDLGIDVRVGLHTGEIQVEGDDISGIGVAIGSRVAAIAGPSEVLVSSTVKDLTAGSGLTFEDAGEHELKGVPDRWRLYRVVDGD